MARIEEATLKRALQIVGLAGVLALLAPLALAQETHVSREGGAWGQEITGWLAAVKNLRVKSEMGLVNLVAVGGNVNASGVVGRVEAESGGGRMRRDHPGGAASADTAGGS